MLTAEAHVLAGLIADGAGQQQDPRLVEGLYELAAALWDLAGRPDMADRTPTDRAVTLAQAMTSTDTGATVSPAEVEVLRTLLAPQAARSRTADDDRVHIVADVISTALARLSFASASDRVARSEETIAHEIELHDAECPADPVVRLPLLLRCPCASTTVIRCSKCGTILQTIVRSPIGCEHVESLCRGDLTGWIDPDTQPA